MVQFNPSPDDLPPQQFVADATAVESIPSALTCFLEPHLRGCAEWGQEEEQEEKQH